MAPDWLRRTLARARVTGRLADVVYSMEATETEFYAHQFKPVLKLLNSPTDALLIADEVGLGKTIEAGLIWTELRARLDAERLLILCPKTLCRKWQIELDRRFGVDARIVDANGLLDLMKERRTSRGFAAIASIQSLRPPKGWKENEPTDPKPSVRVQLARFLFEAAESEPLIDLTVVDEAHHMRNPETLLYDLAELVNAVSAHRVFLSATPIHLRNRDLFALLRLIDPDTFEFEHTLDSIISANAPVVAARDRVMVGTSTAEEIDSLIGEACSHDILSNSQSLALLRNDLKARPLTRSFRSEVASRLEYANPLANFVTRTRRRDVEEFRVVREPIAPTLDFHPDERKFYDAISNEVSKYALNSAANQRFLLATPQRLLTSSPAAASLWWQSYWQGAEGNEVEEEDESDESDPSIVDRRPLVRRLVELTTELELTKRLRNVDTKFALLRDQLNRLWRTEGDAKVIIFSSFKATLRYLEERLQEIEIKTELLHGSVSEPRDVILERFRTYPSRCILLSSEVGSEGVDLQFCWIVVNYDLPWNPMRLEQRIGRVDRLGQKKQKVSIVNLVYEGTIDHQIYDKLYQRLELGKRALGEFEAVLGEPIRVMTTQLLDPSLSEAQKFAAIDQAAQAVEYRAKQSEELETQAGSLMRHGDYIVRQIMESRNLHRWLSGEDVLVYVRARLEQSFSGCVIETSPAGTDRFRIVLSPQAHEAFAAFISRHNLKGTTRLLEGDDRQRFRFTSSVVRSRDGRVENISQVHALVRFAAQLDALDGEAQRPEPVAARLAGAGMKMPCAAGEYIVGVRQWTATSGTGQATGMARLAYSGARLKDHFALSAELAEALVSAAASEATLLPNMSAHPRLEEIATVFDTIVGVELDRRYKSFVDQLNAESEDRANIQLQALDRHLASKLESLNRQLEIYTERAGNARRSESKSALRRNESLLAATAGRVKRLRQRCDQRRSEILSQRGVTPEEADVAALFVEVHD